MSFSKIYLKTLEELLSQMKDLYHQTYTNNAIEIIALEHAINYIKLSTTEYNRLKDKITELKNNKNVLKIKQKDVTKEYENMIQAFECDFNLPFNYNDFTIFDDLKRLIQNKNERLVKDIELLQEFSFGIRYGNLKIIDNGTKIGGKE